ncbi:flavin reductase family protein [Chitinasiproducens palmae]|uniref:NADH-FMN oxidoreductase RutF, flavin reductase (DIM6/NTAB) family n=1 Tax=Chitinasiproducens palmae TaxID=1770053 RepID=A0A1H2PR21_9BURK|nr:flavin reductase family protein [Chitinasiproducens palmae]SDV49321.1 NADH-FMN oxidoreductase RutF, flavin reductase (DIM6/NTAB) family [Chitinasiproducens palmae]
MSRRRYEKVPFPVANVRRYLEPGPIVLLTSRHAGQDNVMTMGWHLVMEFSPSLLGCVIARGNHSHEMIARSGQCVINLPTRDIVDEVVGIGNCSGASVDKFERFGLTRRAASKVAAPLLDDCVASFECRIADRALIDRYDFFMLEVVAAHAAVSPAHPATLHYTGDGVFMVAGKVISRRSHFRPEML